MNKFTTTPSDVSLCLATAITSIDRAYLSAHCPTDRKSRDSWRPRPRHCRSDGNLAISSFHFALRRTSTEYIERRPSLYCYWLVAADDVVVVAAAATALLLMPLVL
jgi:hypothetical protein